MASKSLDQYCAECRQLGLLRSKLVANDGLNEEELSAAIKEKREARDDKLMTLRLGNELLDYSCADEIIIDSHRRRIRRRANGNDNNGRRMEIRYPRADFPERSITSARGSHSLPSSLRKNYLHGGSILEHFDAKALRVIREMTPGSLYGYKCEKVKSEIHPRRLALDVSVAPEPYKCRRGPELVLISENAPAQLFLLLGDKMLSGDFKWSSSPKKLLGLVMKSRESRGETTTEQSKTIL